MAPQNIAKVIILSIMLNLSPTSVKNIIAMETPQSCDTEQMSHNPVVQNENKEIKAKDSSKEDTWNQIFARIASLPLEACEVDYRYPNPQGVLRRIVGDPMHEVIRAIIYYNPDIINPRTRQPQTYRMNRDGTFTPEE